MRRPWLLLPLLLLAACGGPEFKGISRARWREILAGDRNEAEVDPTREFDGGGEDALAALARLDDEHPFVRLCAAALLDDVVVALLNHVRDADALVAREAVRALEVVREAQAHPAPAVSALAAELLAPPPD